MSPTAVWLILCALFLIVEIFTIGFLCFFPGVGAFLAFLVSLVFENAIAAQIAVFIISSTLMIIFVRPIFAKLFKTKDLPTNSDALIGKTGVVLKDIVGPNNIGQVKVSGEVWSAITTEKRTLKQDLTIVVEAIDGVKLVVKEYTE